MADFAVLLTNIKLKFGNGNNPIIAIGGSYGGMLAAWMRLKYGHIINGFCTLFCLKHLQRTSVLEYIKPIEN